jgi:hypothetical protein
LAATQVPVHAPASAALAEQPGPDVTLRVSSHGKLTVKGAERLRAGRVEIAAEGSRFEQGQAVAVAAFDDGYTFRDARADFYASNRGDMKALERLYSKVDFLGGLLVGQQPRTATIVLPRAGTYTAFVLRRRGPTSPVRLQAGAVRRTQEPDVDGVVVARSGHRWGGSENFPTSGRLVFQNRGSQPHLLWMQRVDDGTTIDQVLESFDSFPLDEQPVWLKAGSLMTDAISPGRSMTFDYELRPGQYVQLCMMRDPSTDGTPHVFMGMVRMVHVM